MTPSVVTGPIAADPKPGSDEWERDKRAYDIEVARLAKYRQYEARLAQEIPDLELRVRTLALRLGLPSATAVRRDGQPRRIAAPGETRRRVLDALHAGPGTTREIAERAGIDRDVTNVTLNKLRKAGQVTKDAGYGACWRLTSEPPEGA